MIFIVVWLVTTLQIDPLCGTYNRSEVNSSMLTYTSAMIINETQKIITNQIYQDIATLNNYTFDFTEGLQIHVNKQ